MSALGGGRSYYTDGVLLEGAFGYQTGTFAQVDVFKSIILEEGPVIQNSVQVYIDTPTLPTVDGAYRQVTNLYQASSIDDKVFEVVYSDNYSAKIIFGDGSNGVSPPAKLRIE